MTFCFVIDGLVKPIGSPVWVETDTAYTFVYTATYHDPGITVWKINDTNGFLTTNIPIINISYPSESHAHCIRPNPSSPYHFYVADLGRRLVEHYQIISNQDGTFSAQLRTSLSFPEPSGPRTLAFNPVIDGILYVSEELGAKVSVISFNITTYELIKIEQTVSTTVPGGQGNYTNTAPSHVHTDQQARFLYVANRDNYHLRWLSNNMAIFKLNTSTGLIIEESLLIAPCGGNIPRQFSIDPTHKYMFIANQYGNNQWPKEPNARAMAGQLAIMKIDQMNGNLSVIQILNDSQLGYLNDYHLGPTWVSFINNTVYTQPFEINHPFDDENPCNDDNDELTEIYTMVTCDYIPTIQTTQPTVTTLVPSPTENGNSIKRNSISVSFFGVMFIIIVKI